MTLENKFLSRVYCFKKVNLNLYQADKKKKRINTHISYFF